MSTANSIDRVNIPASQQCPSFDHALGRVNVILGTNGTGKTSLMAALQGRITSWAQNRGINKISPVHGGRVLLASSRSTRPRHEAAQHRDFVRSMFSTEDYNQSNLQRQSEAMLEGICQDHLKCAQEHSAACTKWESEGMPGKMPTRRESNLTRFLYLFNRIFPDITLHFNEQDVSVQCEQKRTRYDPNALSTGEKGIFLLLGRFINKDEPECFLIDEPDRNLNPRLAERFWATLEDWHHPKSVFIYATHLPSFALRPNVDRVFLLDGDEAKEIDGSNGFLTLEPNQRAEFLGTIPSIVTRSKVLVVEGEDGGIDQGDCAMIGSLVYLGGFDSRRASTVVAGERSRFEWSLSHGQFDVGTIAGSLCGTYRSASPRSHLPADQCGGDCDLRGDLRRG